MQKLKPFVKWAGGKGQLINEIQSKLPDFIKNNQQFNYVEPFIGFGAVLFHLLNNYSDNINKIVINDLNKLLDLILNFNNKTKKDLKELLNINSFRQLNY